MSDCSSRRSWLCPSTLCFFNAVLGRAEMKTPPRPPISALQQTSSFFIQLFVTSSSLLLPLSLSCSLWIHRHGRWFDHRKTAREGRSRRLQQSLSADPHSTPLTLPDGCELVAGTFVVFRWEERHCVLQANITLYCWGRRRSGAIEHVLDKHGWTHSSQLHTRSTRPW